MRNLKNINFNLSYRSNYKVNQKEFYNLCLNNSVSYDRAAGYFSSDIFDLLFESLDDFLINEGRIRMIVNPHLSQKDIDDIQLGIRLKEEVIENSIIKELDRATTEGKIKTLSQLALLIYQGKLDIKVAFSDEYNLYHEKFGIFSDSTKYRVAFSGSSNESIGGWTTNFEKIDVFTDSRDYERVSLMENDFNDLWFNRTEGLFITRFSDTIIKKIYSYNPSIYTPNSKENPAITL